MFTRNSKDKGDSTMDFDEKMLRDYLLRMIADANTRASRVLYFDMKAGGMRGVLELGMDNISDFFTGGKFSPVMREIDRYKESRPKSNLAPYYFFDLNTLFFSTSVINFPRRTKGVFFPGVLECPPLPWAINFKSP